MKSYIHTELSLICLLCCMSFLTGASPIVYGFQRIDSARHCHTTENLDLFSQKTFAITPQRIFKGRMKKNIDGGFFENFAIGKQGEIILIDKSILLLKGKNKKRIPIKKEYRNADYFFLDKDNTTILVRGTNYIGRYNFQGKLLDWYDLDGYAFTEWKNSIITIGVDDTLFRISILDDSRNTRQINLINGIDFGEAYFQPNVFIDNDTIFILRGNDCFSMPVNNPNSVQKTCFTTTKSDDVFYSVVGKSNSSFIVVNNNRDNIADPSVSLLDREHRTKTDLIIKGISANIHRDTESEDGTFDNIEYSLWIDKVMYYFDNDHNDLYFLINTVNGIEVYKSNLDAYSK